MARIRDPSDGNSAANPRKRSRESTSPARSPKRREGLNLDLDAPNLPISFSREGSPSKNVHWGRGSPIISGPTITDPERRSQSPTRSALRRPAHDGDEHGYAESEDEHHGPSEQLQADLCKADAMPSQTRSSKKPYKFTYPPPGVGNIVINPTTKPTAVRAKSSKTKTTASTQSSKDQEICKAVDDLKQRIQDFVNRFPARPKKAKSDVLSALLHPENEQLIRYIGCIAMGGAAGAEGWQELLTNNTSRRAVVIGIIGRALKENVFDELYFGASPELDSKLRKMEREQARQDGFYRQRARAQEITNHAARTSRTQDDASLDRASAAITLGLQRLLLPLWCLGDKATEHDWIGTDIPIDLFYIVRTAGKLAREMRASRDVIYYWPPTLKDEEFEPARMECLNLDEMIRQSPYDKQEVNGRDRPVLREEREEESQAIVRVVCFPGIQAYRQGGGELAKKQLAAERSGGNLDADGAPPDVVAMRRKITNKFGEEYTGREGFRTRVISKGVVLLQWGKQRLLTKEAGTSLHIDAVKKGNMSKYDDDSRGHVELLRLFKERTGSAMPSPVKFSPQRSPSFIRGALNYIMGNTEESEEELPIANFNHMHRENQAARQPAQVFAGVGRGPTKTYRGR